MLGRDMLKEEKVLWTGKYDIRMLFTWKDIYLVTLISFFELGH
jgi:hypothetical protein